MLHERLPHVQAGDRLYRAAIADLLNFIEVARPTDSRSKERWKTQQAYWAVNTASCLLSLCEKNGSLSELGRQWYETETPAGSTVLSHVLRSIASLQRVESLAPFWLSILESKDLHKVAVPAFYGLMRSVEQDARVALHFLARARELANNSDSFAAALISFMSHEYLHTGEVCRSEVPNEMASEEGALPERIKFRRTLDDGDIAIMFQGIPRDRREAFVSRVFDVLIQGKALSEDRADHLKSIAMRAAPKYVFLDAVDSTRFTRWPAFHLLHWPVWHMNGATELTQSGSTWRCPHK